ncbi:MAG: 4-hydroxy-3-methylbut-2-en-1-yl diphosphate synthase [Parabacteroides sp.]|jgi:(E)-4-hydroxy-3-methylbut-2-enyl-diphosphate synthase|nr:4-hydroxy-3-methylbut-2-en-1-yl diphosphate synthase [Parabacteroides sp.]MBP8759220.1 4-hydroxy-3-methylbut-2-en-1-yl diphosphate synthase [Parabacteroides sp.]MBP9480161.1 4-hydroxy-3-methylbut-2-en-1-yl diphosphate synthase [Parabacteroides sp.]MBP9578996.1 4-hydroxy-3-methylbut-2-en-1-yl diphosphate synthase [Parabacteroides sp.]MDD3358534.1 4-hydroxy-3-methylbut-2-en-1-yl diphosphate synthase [Parabacteroides sp.]
MNYFNYNRRQSSVVQIGNKQLGGNNPILIQSMANVSTLDTNACVEQAIRIIDAGADYVRFTAQGVREAENLGVIRQELTKRGYTHPLVADIHFNPRAADAAAQVVEKVRINPGNYVDSKVFNIRDYSEEEYNSGIEKIRERFIPFLNLCKQHNTAIRLGINHGSLSDRIMSRYGDTPEGMVASCLEYLKICREEDFQHVAISIKASNTVVMVQTVRLLVKTMDAEGMSYPLHLGVTEAGDGEDGRIKSAVGIGTLLHDGIGDTIRVSLSEEPEAEVPVARKLVDYIQERAGANHVEGSISPEFNNVKPARRISRDVCGIGRGGIPVVISDRSYGLNFEFNQEAKPDYVYVGTEDPDNLPDNMQLLVDAHVWKPRANVFPYFIASDAKELKNYDSPLKFIRLTYADLNDQTLEVLKSDKAVVVILSTHHANGLGAQRAFMHKLLSSGCDVPVILHREYHETDIESLQIKAAADMGAMILDGFCDGIFLNNTKGDALATDNCMFCILQATRARISKTEYISCPGCGRTLYNLQTTIARVKKATSHLKGLKIGIMGCIVNGPGEMADADYGYVGAGVGRISLYKGKECVQRNIPENEAVERLVELIKENGDWKN